jgi:hypothetical protein
MDRDAPSFEPPSAAFDKDAVDAKIAEIERLRQGHTDRSEEARILEILSSMAPLELDDAVRRLPLAGLLRDLDDRPIGPKNHAALLDLLAEGRLGDLSVTARVAVIDALQRGKTGRGDERAIVRIFLGTRGAELTALKKAIDDGDDHRDLQQLVHRDIDDALARRQILDHIRAEALGLEEVHFKILSDIDDTLYCNWVDARYPKKTVYPGVRALYRELDLAPEGTGGFGDLTFLTARPGDRAGIGESITRKSLGERGLPWGKVLTGDFGHLLTHELMAERKYAGFLEYQDLFPEYDFVFIGDSGQGDAIAGGKMMAHPGGLMRAVFIHDVIGTNEEGRAAWRARGVHFNDTYIGAALDAHALGILAADALARVAREAIEELGRIEFEDEAQREARWEEFRRDVGRVNEIVGEGERIVV